jgi:hypothetical protein
MARTACALLLAAVAMLLANGATADRRLAQIFPTMRAPLLLNLYNVN